MGVARLRLLAGCTLIACAVAASIAYEVILVAPVLVPLPSGNYGELYGPVMYFRRPVHACALAMSLVGLWLIRAAIRHRATTA